MLAIRWKLSEKPQKRRTLRGINAFPGAVILLQIITVQLMVDSLCAVRQIQCDAKGVCTKGVGTDGHAQLRTDMAQILHDLAHFVLFRIAVAVQLPLCGGDDLNGGDDPWWVRLGPKSRIAAAGKKYQKYQEQTFYAYHILFY